MELIMKKIKMSQVLMLLLLSVLLFLTPLLSSSLRHTYLYFILNLLIIALGAEAGLLKAFSNPLDHHHHHYQDHMINTSTSTHVIAPLASPEASHDDKTMITNEAEDKNKVKKVMEKAKSLKVAGVVKMVMKVKKCSSMPSLFFIEGGDGDRAHEEDVVEMVVEEEEEEEVFGGDDLSGQELFTKAETFIGNFYNQLKMQREDSWNRIHGFYQKAF